MNSFIDYQRVDTPSASKCSDENIKQIDTKLSQVLGKSCFRKACHVRNPSGQETSFQNNKEVRTIKFDLPLTESTNSLNIQSRKSSRLFYSHVFEQPSKHRRTKSKAEINELPHSGQIKRKAEDNSFLFERKSTTSRKFEKIDFPLEESQSSVIGSPQSCKLFEGLNIQKPEKFFLTQQNKENWESNNENIILSIDEEKRKLKNSWNYQNYSSKYFNDNILETTTVSKMSQKTLTRQNGGLLGGYDKIDVCESVLNSKDSIKEFENMSKISVKFDKNEILETNKKLSINDFHIGECKGEGKFGKIYFAIHKDSGFICALKKIKKCSVKHMMDQFVQEVKIQMFLNHPKLVKMYGYFSDSEHFYMIVEYMEEGSLYSLMKRNKKFEEKEAKEKVREICSGIKEMHENNIVHRDLKPENVVLSHGVCKICDFGWAAKCEGRRKTYCGTLDYVCPEIAEGESYDSGVDVWCIGILAYELMCGKAPFYDISRQKTIEKIKNAKIENFPTFLSENAKRFIENILQKNPENRIGIDELLNSDFLKEINN